MEINLENPIFVLYIHISENSRKTEVLDILDEYSTYFGKYTNATFWIFPNKKETKMELIWSGQKYQKPVIGSDLTNLITHVNEILDLLSKGTSDAEIKAGLRNLQLSKILD